MTDAGLSGEYAKRLTKPFHKAIEEYRLFKSGDKICVCVSGGKDSLLLTALFREYEKHGEMPVKIKYLVMDPGYSENNMDRVKRDLERLDVNAEVYKTEIFKHVEREKNPCFLCSKMRRGHLYKKARELGCTKIALGHHFDDIIESILMGIIYGGQTGTMLPRVRSKNYAGMELIRPLIFVRERDIISWANYCGLELSSCECVLKKRNESSKREYVKRLIERLREDNPQTEMNIFRAVHNVRLDSLMSYKDERGVHDFLDDYDEKN